MRSIVRSVGRPPKYSSVQQLQRLIDKYFRSCWTQKIDMFGNFIFEKDKNGKKTNKKVMVQSRPYTVTGLALAIGTTRDVLIDYQKKDEYSNTIKLAKAMCHDYAESQLFVGKNPTGAIFSLKNNYDWKDKSEVEDKHSGTIAITRKTYK